MKNIKKLINQLKEEILNDSSLKYSIIQHGRRPPIVRLIVENEFLDFKVKEIRTDSTKQVWLGKVADITSDTNYIIHSRKENNWLCITGRVIVHRAEQKLSDFHNKAPMYVIDISYLRPFRRYLASLDRQAEKNKQQNLNNYT